jgi:hypothetical protein
VVNAGCHKLEQGASSALKKSLKELLFWNATWSLTNISISFLKAR